MVQNKTKQQQQQNQTSKKKQKQKNQQLSLLTNQPLTLETERFCVSTHNDKDSTESTIDLPAGNFNNRQGTSIPTGNFNIRQGTSIPDRELQ